VSEPGPKVVSARNLAAATVFHLLSVLLFPITLIGYGIDVGALVAGRKAGVSSSAQAPLLGRWTQHHLGVRRDEPANRLLLALPGVPQLGLWLVAAPLLLAHRLSRYVPKAFRYPFAGEVPVQDEAAARQTFVDTVVDRYLAEITQLVILGAGFDTRAFRLPDDTPVRAFEVDAPKTQAIKREGLAQAGLDSTGVTFVAADLEQEEDWRKLLIDAGFDPHEPALFLWEGVTMYLERAAVATTLRQIAGTARGSVVAFDYVTTESLVSTAFSWRYAQVATRAAGEPLTLGVESTPPSRERLAELLRSCGLSLGEQRTLGAETDGKRAWGGVATALVT
jgi:methyltransferase (TIGR00027 family)